MEKRGSKSKSPSFYLLLLPALEIRFMEEGQQVFHPVLTGACIALGAGDGSDEGSHRPLGASGLVRRHSWSLPACQSWSRFRSLASVAFSAP